jgi:putative ABC transport system permease protein
MIKNFFKIAFRNLRKNKVFSFINIFGLAVGLTCFMLIAAFVYNELNYDKYAAGYKNIYRVNLGNGEVAMYPHVDEAVGEGMKNAFPEIQSFTRMNTAGDNFVKYQDKQFKEQHLAYVDSNFLQMFSIPLTEGSNEGALVQPNSIVISKSFANKYFGEQQALGKFLVIGNQAPFKVTGLFDQIPQNSHFHFDALMSLSTWPMTHKTWSNVGTFTYLKLNENADPQKLVAKFPQLVTKYVVPEIQRDMGVSLAEARKSVNTFVFTLQPITDIHLRSNTKYELEPNGDIQYVYIFAALAVFILLLACINFTNLSTASAVKRSREVGIRKVMGSLKKELIFQFLTESVFLTMLAMVLAFLFIFLLLPHFNLLANKNIEFGFFTGYQFVIFILLLTLTVGLLAGIYPSFFLSSFNTIKVLKGSASAGSSKNNLRSGLVIFQFFVSTTLIIATVVVYQQLHFMQNKKLGYDKEQVLFIPDAYLLGASQNAFRDLLLLDNRVVSASMNRTIPGSPNMDGSEIYPITDRGGSATIHTNIYHVDYDFLKTLGIKIVDGRNFSKDFPTDSTGVVINQAAVDQLGWSKTDPIGQRIMRSGQREYHVVGVVSDFHYASVKQKIAPLIMTLGHNEGGLIVKIKTTNVKGFLSDLKNHWAAFSPSGPLEYSFLDEKFASLYTAEQSTGRIFTAFTIVAILIACLGLFGLAAFITEQRTREIGIRKVLGASVNQLLVLVSGDFLKLVGIAFLISIPVTWWAMNSWLNDFAYRIYMPVWVFPFAGFAAILIALLTISFQAVKASLANPVDSLRSE